MEVTSPTFVLQRQPRVVEHELSTTRNRRRNSQRRSKKTPLNVKKDDTAPVSELSPCVDEKKEDASTVPKLHVQKDERSNIIAKELSVSKNEVTTHRQKKDYYRRNKHKHPRNNNKPQHQDSSQKVSSAARKFASRQSQSLEDTSASGLSDEDAVREQPVVTIKQELRALFERLSSMHYRSLQSLCNYGCEGAFDNQAFGITPQDWMSCYVDGQGCHDKMVFKIATMIRRKVYSPTTAPLKDLEVEKRTLLFSGSEVEHIRGLLEALPTQYYGTLQIWCNSGDGGPWFEKYRDRVDPALWKACYDDTDDCEEVMVANIRGMFEKLIAQRKEPSVSKDLVVEKSTLLFSGSEVEHIRGLLEALSSRFYATLQAWCNSGDGGPWFEKYRDRVDSELWKACFDDTDDCQEVMVANIRGMFEKLIAQSGTLVSFTQ